MQHSTTSIAIREVQASDLETLAAIHVTSFNATYPAYNPKPGFQFRLQEWQRHFSLQEDRWFCWVAVAAGQPVGFATGHDFFDARLLYQAQLDKIHLLKNFQRLGLGSKLVAHVAQTFLLRGQRSMILFADPDNPALRFYDQLGGERLLDEQGQFRGAFGWQDSSKLTAFL